MRYLEEVGLYSRDCSVLFGVVFYPQSWFSVCILLEGLVVISAVVYFKDGCTSHLYSIAIETMFIGVVTQHALRH